MINRRQSLSALFVALTASLTCVYAGTEKDPSVAELAGTWNVENPTDRHELKGAKAIQLNLDGTASIVHSNMTFQRRWKLVNGQLTISDPPGQVPGPPVRFAIAEVDATRTRMRLKGDFPSAAKDVQLVRSK
jgi:hypothetical protein